MACRLQDNKHPLESIEAFHRLRDDYPDWKLEIAGNGPDFDRCRALVDDLGEQDRIRPVSYTHLNDMIPEIREVYKEGLSCL